MKQIKAKSILLLLLEAFGYSCLNGAAFVMSTYQTLFLNGMHMNATTIGICMSVIGIVTVVGYLLGGILGDIFPTRALLIVSHAGVAIGLFILSLNPPFAIVLVAEFCIGLFAIGTYWGAMARFVKSLGPSDLEGKLYGFFYGFQGISGTIIGFTVAGLVAAFGDETYVYLMLYIYIAINIVAILSQIFLYRGYTAAETAEEDKFKFSDLKAVAKCPDIWIAGFILFAAEQLYPTMAYFAPMLQDEFAVASAIVTVVVTIRLYFMRMVISPTAGALVDKLKSPLKVMTFACIGSLVITLVITFMPWDASLGVVAIVIVILMAAIFNLATPCWFTMTTEIRVPDRVRGTAVGLVTLLAFCADIYIYLFGGWLIDSFGSMGYRIFFGYSDVVFIIGIILCFVLRKRIKSGRSFANTAKLQVRGEKE